MSLITEEIRKHTFDRGRKSVLKRDYYLYKIFFKLPTPYLLWPSIITAIYIILYLINNNVFLDSIVTIK